MKDDRGTACAPHSPAQTGCRMLWSRSRSILCISARGTAFQDQNLHSAQAVCRFDS